MSGKNDKVFKDHQSIINWIPENETGDIEGTKQSIEVIVSLLDENDTNGILVDLSKAERPDSHQRQIIVNAVKSNISKIKRIAIFGETPLLKTIAYFIINATGYSNMKFFDTRNHALAWLNGDDKHDS